MLKTLIRKNDVNRTFFISKIERLFLLAPVPQVEACADFECEIINTRSDIYWVNGFCMFLLIESHALHIATAPSQWPNNSALGNSLRIWYYQMHGKFSSVIMALHSQYWTLMFWHRTNDMKWNAIIWIYKEKNFNTIKVRFNLKW